MPLTRGVPKDETGAVGSVVGMTMVEASRLVVAGVEANTDELSISTGAVGLDIVIETDEPGSAVEST